MGGEGLAVDTKASEQQCEQEIEGEFQIDIAIFLFLQIFIYLGQIS